MNFLKTRKIGIINIAVLSLLLIPLVQLKFFSNAFINPDNLTSFTIMISGYCIGLLMIAKDIVFLKEKIGDVERACFRWVMIFSIAGFTCSLVATSTIATLPANKILGPKETRDELQKITGAKFIYDPTTKEVSVTLPEYFPKEDYAIYLEDLYKSLSVSEQDAMSHFIRFSNPAIYFFIIAIINLFYIAFFKLKKNLIVEEEKVQTKGKNITQINKTNPSEKQDLKSKDENLFVASLNRCSIEYEGNLPSYVAKKIQIDRDKLFKTLDSKENSDSTIDYCLSHRFTHFEKILKYYREQKKISPNKKLTVKEFDNMISCLDDSVNSDFNKIRMEIHQVLEDFELPFNKNKQVSAKSCTIFFLGIWWC